ncbi:hypothetical protein U8C35_06400 [Sinorhizobium medicae]|uniref:hypothetical protein n=1 Tax=Sinorhizobium medicae TaxID=110321 RepID=UPI002AF6C8F7|nr:hypothetical protein [Sinorhizobium medicae]WQO60063.1 hypothetical protein U8C35_06400 [Sinorhizobium medicae]
MGMFNTFFVWFNLFLMAANTSGIIWCVSTQRMADFPTHIIWIGLSVIMIGVIYLKA